MKRVKWILCLFVGHRDGVEAKAGADSCEGFARIACGRCGRIREWISRESHNWLRLFGGKVVCAHCAVVKNINKGNL